MEGQRTCELKHRTCCSPPLCSAPPLPPQARADDRAGSLQARADALPHCPAWLWFTAISMPEFWAKMLSFFFFFLKGLESVKEGHNRQQWQILTFQIKE